MNAREMLLDCLAYYGIPVVGSEGDLVLLPKGYAVEVESNGLYRLLSDGAVVAPFDDLDDLSTFILNH
jgi:hypothetical protein